MTNYDFSKAFSYPTGNRADQLTGLLTDIIARLGRLEDAVARLHEDEPKKRKVNG